MTARAMCQLAMTNSTRRIDRRPADVQTAARRGLLVVWLVLGAGRARAEVTPVSRTPTEFRRGVGASLATTTLVAPGDSVSVRLVDVELRIAVQSLAQYLDRPVLFGAPAGTRVTLETPRPIPRGDVLRLLRGLVEAQGLEFVSDSAAGFYRVRAKEVQRPAPVPADVMAQRAAGVPALFVIRLRHARAANVAAIVNALYGRASAFGELGAPPAGTLDQGLRQNVLPPQSGALQGTAGYPGSVATGGRAAALTGETTIVPDPGTNSLLVRASRGDYELIQAAVRELDVRPLQVLIEVVIAEVRRDRSLSFGVEASVPESRVPRIDGARGTVTQHGLGTGDFAVRIMRRGPGLDIDATLRAAAARGDAKILSRPVVIAANNEAAEILVGSQRPFVQVSRSLPTNTPSRDQVVQYKDVGTRLRVRPTISADGYVALSVTQEVNSATAETQFDAPVISTRTVETHLLVRDSQTVVLGGLADKQREVSQVGVPVLSAIPLVGGLFGHTTRRTTETEFFLFITPRVIRTDEEAERVTAPLEQRSVAPELRAP